MKKRYDIVVIGAGSGLQISSQAASRGLKVAVIEKGPFGGTCLNRGCIPSKIFIHAADVAETIKNSGKFGINSKLNKVDWSAIQKRVWNHIDPDAKAIEKGNKDTKNIDVYKTEARFISDKEIQVGKDTITGSKIFICAGARPSIPPIPGIEKTPHYTSANIMRLKKQPKSMAIIGAGYIAAEMAHFFSALGTNVTVINRSSLMIKREDKEVSETFTKIASKKYNIFFNANTQKIYKKGKNICLDILQGKKKKTISAEILLLATGRRPNTDILSIEKTKIKTDQRGFIKTNQYMETSVKNIWAIGDIAGKYMFKHSANLEAAYAAHNAFNPNKIKVDYTAMPHAIFSSPQIAGAGFTEQELKDKKIKYLSGKYRYYHTGMGAALEDKDGFVKVFLNPKNHKILGCHILGTDASTLIHEVLVAMRANQKSSAITRTIHIHPALPEVVQRAFNDALA